MFLREEEEINDGKERRRGFSKPPQASGLIIWDVSHPALGKTQPRGR